MSTIFTLEKLYKAYMECQKGKKNTINALNFEVDREKNLILLLEELRNGTYKISRHIYFVVTNPTPREIFAADFRDRIVHHLLCNEIQSVFEENFISGSYANRKGKGTHAAVNELRKNIREVKSKTGHGYYLKLDIQRFFPSINREILYGIVEKKILNISESVVGAYLGDWKEEVLYVAKKIIFHDPTKNYLYKGDPKKKNLIPKHKSLFFAEGRGLPIGNLTSQFFANVYMNEFDQFMTRELKVKYYIRYVDDFVMVNHDKAVLLSQIVLIRNFLKQHLDLDLHPNKIHLQNTSKGIDFLGYFIKSTHTLIRQKVVKRFKNKLYQRRNNKDGLFSVNDIPMIRSYLGHFSHANTFNLKKKFES